MTNTTTKYDTLIKEIIDYFTTSEESSYEIPYSEVMTKCNYKRFSKIAMDTIKHKLETYGYIVETDTTKFHISIPYIGSIGIDRKVAFLIKTINDSNDDEIVVSMKAHNIRILESSLLIFNEIGRRCIEHFKKHSIFITMRTDHGYLYITKEKEGNTFHSRKKFTHPIIDSIMKRKEVGEYTIELSKLGVDITDNRLIQEIIGDIDRVINQYGLYIHNAFVSNANILNLNIQRYESNIPPLSHGKYKRNIAKQSLHGNLENTFLREEIKLLNHKVDKLLNFIERLKQL